MVKALCLGYLVLLYYLLPVLQEPLEFPYYASWCAKAQALQREAERMLERGALELIDCLGQVTTVDCL